MKTCLLCGATLVRGEREWPSRFERRRFCDKFHARLFNRGSLASELEYRSIPEPNTGCWLWMGPPDNGGYGSIRFGGKLMKSHRASWTAFRGEIPTGMCVLHQCDNPSCINPEHLFLGTRADNIQDMIQKGRDRKIAGETHHKAKLSRTKVAIIKDSPLSSSKLAAQYGVHKSTIRSIMAGKTWKDQ